MHHNIKDLTGRKSGRWTVIAYIGKSHWLCKCECGTERSVFTGNLGGKSLSCGCLRAELASAKNGTHRLCKSPEYKVWAGMKRRCTNPNEESYVNYGERGITVCQAWANSFEAFISDIGPRPSSGHSIERIENNKGYEPGNCRWATRIDQARNKRNTRLITFNNQTKSLSEWANETGIGRATIAYRIASGWDVERALTIAAIIGRNQY